MAITTSVVLYDPMDTSPEVLTLAGFLAGFSGRTREAYTLDLRQFYRWCDEHRLDLLEVRQDGTNPARDPARLGLPQLAD